MGSAVVDSMSAEEENLVDEQYDDVESKCQIDDVTGMPIVKDADEGVSAGDFVKVMVLIVVPRVVCLLFAAGIFFIKKDMYLERMKVLQASIQGIGWLFLAGGTFAFLIEFSNYLPGVWKSKVFPGNAGNMRANMSVYKIQQSDPGRAVKPNEIQYTVHKAKPLPYVMMETEGAIGQYNRANRGMYHLVENGMHVLVCFILAGLVFGEAVFLLVLGYFVTRVWYQYAYTIGGYGFGCCKHAVPFMFHSAIIAHILELLVWLAGVRMVSLQYGSTVTPAA